MPKSYHIHTFGCQMNVADSGHVAAQLEALGYQPAERVENADVIVVNTCVVRQSAEEKAIGKLGALAPIKRRKPGTVIGLMGCMVGVRPSAALTERLMAVLRTAMGVANIKVEAQLTVIGTLLIVAVILSDVLGRRRRPRS